MQTWPLPLSHEVNRSIFILSCISEWRAKLSVVFGKVIVE